MADGVKWIKISTDMFDNLKIRQIEALPDGDAILVIWVHLLLLAGRVNDSGMIYLTREIPYTDQMLAIEMRKPIATVQMALDVFTKFGMVETTDDMLCISHWSKYQNTDRLEQLKEQSRERSRKYRENKKIALNSSDNVTLQGVTRHVTSDATSRSKNKNIDKDIDKDIDIDTEKREKEKDIEDIKTSCTEQNKSAPVLADVDPVILNDGSEWRPDIDLYHEYQRLYPAVDVGAEFAKMRGWCLGNPKKRKTKSGVKRFVTSWLGRAQDEYHPAQAKSGSAYIDAIRKRVDIVDTWT